jgi:hypothetical protein
MREKKPRTRGSQRVRQYFPVCFPDREHIDKSEVFVLVPIQLTGAEKRTFSPPQIHSEITAMAVGRFMAVFGLVGGAAAQCTLPEALPEATQFAAGNPEECVLGERATHGLLAARPHARLPASPWVCLCLRLRLCLCLCVCVCVSVPFSLCVCVCIRVYA